MDKIAILGMGCLFPGYCDKDELWEKLLRNELFTITENFKGRQIERGGIPKNSEKMNWLLKSSFGDKIPEVLDTLGEIYKWTTYVCNEALKETGYNRNHDVLKRTGLVMGTLGMPTIDSSDILRPVISTNLQAEIRGLLEDKDFVFHSPAKYDGLDPKGAFTDTEPTAVAAGLLSLGGPALTFNAACATPLYGFKLASIYLSSHKADMMIVGSNCSNEHVKGNCGLFDALGVLCDKGGSRPFDRDTEGLVAASGAGAFVIKRLEDAVRDGDKILGVIESIGWSNDGGSKSILAPSMEGQIRALSDAYKGNLSCDIDYIECHATGTKAGDQIELDSISNFFKEKGTKPLLGALKANMGHCFTASANASVAKILLSMKHGVIPATLSINNPLHSSDGYITGEDMALKNVEWPQKGKKKRAGVNAFGFGGINAHMVISEHKPEEDNVEMTGKRQRESTAAPVAIVGMGIHIGKYDTLNKFFDALAKCKPDWEEPDSERWRGIEADAESMKSLGLERMPKGCYINKFPFDFIKYKIPPKVNPYLIRRDLLLLTVAAQALEDADINPGDYKNTAVIINCSQDFSDLRFMVNDNGKEEIFQNLRDNCPGLNDKQQEAVFNILRQTEINRETTDSVTGIIPNIRANRISSNWKFEGPSFILMEKENSIARSLEIARILLSEGIVDCVVVGTVEFAGELEHIFVQKQIGKLESLLDNGIGEGAAVLVLKKKEQAEKDGNRIYSLIEGISLSGGASLAGQNTAVSPLKIRECVSEAINQASIGEKELGYIDLPFVFYQKEKQETEKIYLEQYPALTSNADTVMGSVETVTGCCFSLTAAASVIKNALQLYYKIKFPSEAAGLNPWVRNGGKRTAITGSFTVNGSCAQIVMSDYQKPMPAEQQKGGIKSLVLIPVAASTENELLDKLEVLRKDACGKKGFKKIVADAWNACSNIKKSGPVYTFCIICNSKETLLTEIQAAKQNIIKAFESGQDWKSSRGSYFSPKPVGRDGKVVWMCPPGGMVAFDKICDIVRVYPELRNIVDPSHENSTDLEEKTDKFFFSSYIAEFYTTKLVAELLIKKAGIKPDIAIGASMGEIALPYALGCLDLESGGTDADLILKNMLDIFTILEDKKACEEYFGHAVDELQSWYVKQSREQVEAIVADEPLVFVTITGSPSDVIICGEKEACRRVLEKLKGYRMSLNGSMFVHTPIAARYYDKLYQMALNMSVHIKHKNPVSLYSTYSGKPLSETGEAYAENITNIITKQVDFENILNRAYEDGGRVFIDIGTNGLCEMWAENTLHGKDAHIISLSSVKSSFEESWCHFLATVISHDLSETFQNLCPYSMSDIDEKPEFIKIVSTGLPHHSIDVSTEENRRKIKALAAMPPHMDKGEQKRAKDSKNT